MSISRDLVSDLTHNAVFIDQEGLPTDAHELLAIEVFLLPDSVKLAYARIGIRQQRERQAVFVREFAVRGYIIGAHAQHHDAAFLHFAIGIAEAASFFSAAGGVVFWIKVQNNIFAA